MNIYVCIKQVPDTETKIKLKPDSTWIDTTGIKWIMSPYDEFAVEEALQIKAKNAGSTITAVCAGPARVQETIRTALAMGCDHGIHIDLPENADCFMAAKAIAGVLGKEAKVDVVYTGKEAIDDGAAQTSQLIASLMGIPCVTVALKADIAGTKVTCQREIEGGAFEIVESSLPAVIAAQKGMNKPRYASLPEIMKAKKKEIKTIPMSDAGVAPTDMKIKVAKLELPPPKQAGKKIAGEPAAQAQNLAKLLREEAKVI